jgi:hypothetical protein
MKIPPIWLLFSVLVLVWFPTLFACFFWDDHRLVLDNPMLGNIKAIFFQDLTWDADRGVGTPFYRPLLLLSLSVDSWLWPGNAPLYHAWGFFLHLGNCIFLYKLAKSRFTEAQALVAMGIFGLHPIQTEAVTWVSARNDPLCLLGILGVLWAFEKQSWLLGALFSLIAMFSKEIAVLMPLLILGWRWSRIENIRWQELAITAGVAGLFLGFREAAELAPLHASESNLALAASRWPLIPITLLGWLVWPVLTSTASLYQPFPVFPFPMLVSAIILLLVLLRKPREAGGLLVVALLLLAPALVVIGASSLIGERYLYAPLAFLALAIAQLVPTDRRILGTLALLAGLTTLLRLVEWQSEESLMEAAWSRSKDSYTAYRVGYSRIDQDPKGAFQAMYAAATGHPPFIAACAPAVGLLAETGAYDKALKLAEELTPSCSGRAEFLQLKEDLYEDLYKKTNPPP